MNEDLLSTRVEKIAHLAVNYTASVIIPSAKMKCAKLKKKGLKLSF